MRRLSVALLALLIAFGSVWISRAAEPPLPSTAAQAAIVVDRSSGMVLGVKNPDQRRAMASTTKMMTALLALEYAGSNVDVMFGPVSVNAAGTQGTTMNLRAGDRLSLRDLLYGLMLPSGNDAAVAIAEGVSGNVDAFVNRMNQRAQELGLTNTAYRSPHGLDPAEYGGSCGGAYASLPNCGHYSSARDLATLAQFAMNKALFSQIVKTVSWTPTTWVDSAGNQRNETLRNDNLLLSSMPYQGADGVKTGATPNAGYCMVASATRSGQAVMSVVMGCSSDNSRHQESMSLLDYGFSQLGGDNAFINGSFEQDYYGWTASGNQRVIGGTTTDGSKAVQFNFGQLSSNGVLTQSFSTTPGQNYVLEFDFGVSAYQSTAEQRLQVTAQGNAVLLSQTISASAQGTGTWFYPHNYSFVADSETTTLLFEDISPTTTNIDCYLDYVRMGSPMQLTSAVSRKAHGSAGVFDVDLPLSGTPGVECRSSNGAHTVVFTFSQNAVSGTAAVTDGVGSATGSPTFGGNTMTINLSGVADAQTLKLAVTNVRDEFGQTTPATEVKMSVLAGDTSGNGLVNSTDISQTKAQSGAVVSASNFREDVTANGTITSSDISFVKAHSGTAIGPNAATRLKSAPASR